MKKILATLLAIVAVTAVAYGMDINGELKNALLERLSANPTGYEGRIFWDTDDDEFRVHNGTTWLTVADSSNAITNPMDSAGDMIYGGSGGAATKLDSGTNGKTLRSGGAAAPTWSWQQTTSAQSADYTITDTDGFTTILVTTSSTNRTITLPTSADNAGRQITIKKVDNGTGFVIIDGESSESIDGSATVTVQNQYGSVTVLCNGTEWFRVDGPAGLGTPGTISQEVSGTFTGSMSGGFSSNPSDITYSYYRVGKTMHIYCNGTHTGTSSAVTNITLSGFPAALAPTDSNKRGFSRTQNNGSFVSGLVQLNTSGDITIFGSMSGGTNSFNASGSKGWDCQTGAVFYY